MEHRTAPTMCLKVLSKQFLTCGRPWRGEQRERRRTCVQHEALSGGRAGSEMFPTSASSCSESSWGFPLTEVIVSRVTGFALGDKKHVCSRVQGQMEQRQWEGGCCQPYHHLLKITLKSLKYIPVEDEQQVIAAIKLEESIPWSKLERCGSGVQVICLT